MASSKFSKTMHEVFIELQRQDEKWGVNRILPDEIWLTIMTEEVGESAQAILKQLPTEDLRKEIIQIIAVGYAWLECIDRCGDGHE